MLSKNKIAQAVWISWVLLILMVVVVGTIAGRYIINRAKDDAESIKKYALNAEECNNVEMSVDFICKNSKDLNMTVSNKGIVNIDMLLLKLFDTAGNSENREIDVEIRPEQENKINIPRGNSGYEIEITPAVKVEGQLIECSDYMITEINIQDC